MTTHSSIDNRATKRPIGAVLATATGATLAACALAFATPQAQAAELHYVLPDLGGFDTWMSEDRAQTFAGTGFIGLTNDIWSGRGPAFAHAFNLEPAQFGRTLVQLDLAGLAGAQIVSASLSFRLLDGQEAPGTAEVAVAVAGFDSGGQLGLQWDAPVNDLEVVFGEVDNMTLDSQSIDITSLLRQGTQRGWDTLGLHLQNLGDDYLYTFTHEYPDILSPDRAQVRIDVITAAVPEPASFVLALAGGAAMWGVGALRARRQRRAATPSSETP